MKMLKIHSYTLGASLLLENNKLTRPTMAFKIDCPLNMKSTATKIYRENYISSTLAICQIQGQATMRCINYTLFLPPLGTLEPTVRAGGTRNAKAQC